MLFKNTEIQTIKLNEFTKLENTTQNRTSMPEFTAVNLQCVTSKLEYKVKL